MVAIAGAAVRSLFDRPIVRASNQDQSGESSRMVEMAFRRLSNSDFLSRALGLADDTGLDVSIHLEVYVSKYNTADDIYWVKPNKEQEKAYKGALSDLFSKAVELACNKIGYRWKSQAAVRPSCVTDSPR